MKEERWTVVDRLLGEALERAPHERAAFLSAACANDEELRRDVESLLAHDSGAGDFLEQPAVALSGTALTRARQPMTVGRDLGPYRILELLGSGGMGDVYRALDTRLKRHVALKLLPDSLAGDPERLGRFRREAEILASLNHSHIAGIHGIEESGGHWALVLELVEGETLADRLARGPIPRDESIAIAGQILEALDAAHEQGIIHRDLKPANIKVAPAGLVKVLDFGLAKLTSPPNAERAFDPAVASPTGSPAALTHEGIILGTAAYMAPEQAGGKAVDRRADVWAFGAVLFEMLAGRRAFAGEDVQEALAAVLRDEPDWSALPANTPPRVRRALELCLEKDMKRRVRDIATVRAIMAGTFETPATGAHAASIERNGRSFRRTLTWAAAIAAASIGALAAAWSVRPAAREPVSRAVIPVPPDRFNLRSPVVSRNGEYFAYAWSAGGARTLSLYRMSEPEGPPLAEFAGGSYPFFSPDSAWLGFFAGRELRKVSVLGGPAQTLAPADAGRGGSWGDDGRIVFAPSYRSGLSRVSAADGRDLEMLTSPDPQLDESGHRVPHVLPGSAGVLFTALRTRGPALVAASVKTGKWHTLVDGAAFGSYVSTGHLLYVQAGRLMAAPFDVERLAITGTAVPFYDTGETNDVATFGVTDKGLLLYQSGSRAPSMLVWVDRSNNVAPLVTGSCAISASRGSPRMPRVSSRPAAKAASGFTTWPGVISRS
jgi:serine/threonine-protein kinase